MKSWHLQTRDTAKWRELYKEGPRGTNSLALLSYLSRVSLLGNCRHHFRPVILCEGWGTVLDIVGCLATSNKCCDNQKYLQTLSNVPLGSKSLLSWELLRYNYLCSPLRWASRIKGMGGERYKVDLQGQMEDIQHNSLPHFEVVLRCCVTLIKLFNLSGL